MGRCLEALGPTGVQGKRAESEKQVPKAQHTWQGESQLALRKGFKYLSRGIA